MNNYFRTAVALAALAASACVFAQEITLYSGHDFKGRSVTLHKEAVNFEQFGFNDKVSSLRLGPGTSVILFADKHHKGKAREYNVDTPVLGDFEDKPLAAVLEL